MIDFKSEMLSVMRDMNYGLCAAIDELALDDIIDADFGDVVIKHIAQSATEYGTAAYPFTPAYSTEFREAFDYPRVIIWKSSIGDTRMCVCPEILKDELAELAVGAQQLRMGCLDRLTELYHVYMELNTGATYD